MAVLKYTLNGSTYTAVPAGPKGDKGDQGNPGATGATGQMGATGPVRMYVQPAQPDVQVVPGGYPLWLDTDAPAPVANYQVTHPNTDDVLVQAWDSTKSRWQTTHYHSSVRNIVGLLINGWTATALQIVREDSFIRLYGYGINGVAATANAFLPSMPGFSPDGWGVFVNAGNFQNGALRTISYAGGFSADRTVWTSGVTVDVVLSTFNATPASLPGTLVVEAPA